MSLGLRLFIAMLLALVLTILPLPTFISGFRPPWALMLILYLQCFLPDYFNTIMLLIVGLLLDVLLSTVLGEHVFALSLVTWIASNKARRFSFFSIGQQMTLIGFFCLFYQMVILVIDAFLGNNVSLIMSLGSVLIAMLLWPWVKLIADDTLYARYTKIVYKR